MTVQDLFIYPIKSSRAQKMPQLQIQEGMVVGDRQWMLIDDSGKFLSQRTFPKMALIEVFYEKGILTIGLGKMFFKIPGSNSFQRRATVKVWDDTFEAALEPDLYSQGIAQYLGVSCRLARYAPYSQREKTISMADSRPLLLVNTKSLEDLNSKLQEPVAMDRFRPNIVFAGTEAYEEDRWQRIQIGEVVFSKPKKCSRCIMIDVDQKTGEAKGPEPLKTLASYRRGEKGVDFGVLWTPENEGVVRPGDSIQVLQVH